MDSQPTFRANSRNRPEWRKWAIVIALMLIDVGLYWIAHLGHWSSEEMKIKYKVSSPIDTTGLALYVLSLTFGPNILACLSGYFGRSPLYIISYGIFLLFVLAAALVHSFQCFYVLRYFSGLFSSVATANFGGIVADLWDPHETEPGTSVFLWGSACGAPYGYVLFSIIAINHSFGDTYWALLGTCGGYWLIMILTIREARHSVLLARKHRYENRNTGHSSLPRTQRTMNDLKPMFVLLCYVYCITCLMNSVLDGVVIGPKHYGVDKFCIGFCVLFIVVEIITAPITSTLFQEPTFKSQLRKDDYKNTPEGRALKGKFAVVAFPTSMFLYAWIRYKSTHWIVPVLASILFVWSVVYLILIMNIYTEESYKTYTASAVARIGLMRNLVEAGYHLFGTQNYYRPDNQVAASLFAGLVFFMVPIPFVLGWDGSAHVERDEARVVAVKEPKKKSWPQAALLLAALAFLVGGPIPFVLVCVLGLVLGWFRTAHVESDEARVTAAQRPKKRKNHRGGAGKKKSKVAG